MLEARAVNITDSPSLCQLCARNLDLPVLTPVSRPSHVGW